MQQGQNIGGNSRQVLKWTSAILAVLVLAGCGANAQQLPIQVDALNSVPSVNTISKVRMKTLNKNNVEAVSAVGFDGTHIRATVISHGCTHAKDFSINHAIVEGRCSVTIERTKPDLCRRAPMLAEMLIEWSAPDDCVDLEMVIANPVLVTAGNGRMIKRPQ